MRIAIELLTIYGVYVFGTALLIWRYGSKDRGPSIVVAAIIPAIAIVSVVQLLALALLRRSPRISPCPEGLEQAELIVESHRQRMFGGQILKPRFASDWARVYAATLEQDTERVENFARKVLSPA